MIGNARWPRLRNSSWYGLREPRVTADAERVVEWLLHEDTAARLEQACLAEQDPRMAELLSFAAGLVWSKMARRG